MAACGYHVILLAIPMPTLYHLDRSKSPQGGEPVEADVAQLREASLAAVYYAPRSNEEFYDFLRVGSTGVLFAMLDSVDHLEDNQAVTAAVQTNFREAGLRVFAKKDLNPAEAMIELCLELNRTILQAGKARSCPAFVGCYEETLGTVWYVNAGPTAALVRDPAGVTELPATGLPLGLFSHLTCDASAVVLQPGAALLIASRGIVEAKSHGAEFGLEAVKTALRETTAANAHEICLSILARVREFIGAAPEPGEVTALALVRSTGSTAVKVDSRAGP
jgi:serine phosphatase RsbU (regulator of sigma subunit)